MSIQYNGLQLPAVWPPKNHTAWFENHREPMPVPYLSRSGIPDVIPINIGRQLFIDDFLIEETSLKRVLHKPKKYVNNPIVGPERDFEQSSVYFVGEPVIWDDADKLFKLWYSPGHWIAPRALLFSRDGLYWERPELNVVPSTNLVMPKHSGFAICTIIRDYEEKNSERAYKAHGWDEMYRASVFLSSPDGIHWREEARWKNGYQDTTNIFYNPFRKKWVYNPKIHPIRIRGYAEFDRFEDLFDKAKVEQSVIRWFRADERDDASADLEQVNEAQIYDLYAMPYESIMLASINVWYGPDNKICSQEKIPKLLQLHMGYSRDGFHWHRPTCEPFIAAQRSAGNGHPEFGYLRSAGSVLNVVGDQLHFYYMSCSGVDKNGEPSVYDSNYINVATMRRDGFASMEANSEGGTLTTRPVLFTGHHLFINADCSEGELRVEMLDQDGHVIAPFSVDQCEPVTADSTCHAITWRDAGDLAAWKGKPVRFRFVLQQAKLYAFWVSPDKHGASHGYVAGGGPGLAGSTDTTGQL